MKTNALALIALVGAGMALPATAALAQSSRSVDEGRASAQTSPTGSNDEAEPEPASLAVGALQIAADPRLSLASMNIRIAEGRVIYSYALRNGGGDALNMLATVGMPSLQASSDNSQAWTLPAQDAENPVRLEAIVGGQPVPTLPHVSVQALGLDRSAEMKASGLPLIPFGKATDKALRELNPEAAARLSQLGLVARGGQGAGLAAGWTLDTTREFQLGLAPGAATEVKLSFVPIAAEFVIGQGDEEALDAIKSDYCASPRAVSALHSRMKGGGSWRATEITVNVDGPSARMETPDIGLSVQKPRPDSIVAFCGLNEKTSAGAIAVGAAPEDIQDSEVRIMIFTPADR